LVENCDHNCAECALKCDDKEKMLAAMKVAPGGESQVKHVIGIISGKGGVGKSVVTSLLAVAMQRRGYQAAILDADITGPSIPQAFGITNKAKVDASGILPEKSKTGIKIISINLLLDRTTDAVIWRGPLIAGTVKQFWTEVNWGAVDYMFVDMPPGTGDVPLTVFQSLPLDGVIIVTSPQQLVAMIVEKAANMAQTMFVPILGLVENMSYFTCPHCGTKSRVFGESHLGQIASQHGIKLIAELPIAPAIAAACDEGRAEEIKGEWLDKIADMLEEKMLAAAKPAKK
jgi:Mrp family chromosome partitioning ATPase